MPEAQLERFNALLGVQQKPDVIARAAIASAGRAID
jgi:hypothetical protein